MENNLTNKTLLKIRALGIYQVAGGVIGLGLTYWVIVNQSGFPDILILFFLIAIALYAYSIFCGVLLLKKNIAGLRYSLINQFLQLGGFSLLGFTFQYVSGIFIAIGIDFSNSFSLTFNFGISSWQIAIHGNPGTIMVGVNFFALVLIFFIDRLRKTIGQEQIDDQISSIGQ